MNIEALDPVSYDDAVDGLAELLVDAVDGGAAVNFLAGVSHAEAAAWWADRSAAVAAGTITVFVARDGDRIIGSTLLERSRNPNSPHRAEIGKVIVHRSARRQGLGSALMRTAEDRARLEGRWLLVLDTVTDSPAAALYESLGWRAAGVIPDYAFDTEGTPEAATYYYKDLR